MSVREWVHYFFEGKMSRAWAEQVQERIELLERKLDQFTTGVDRSDEMPGGYRHYRPDDTPGGPVSR